MAIVLSGVRTQSEGEERGSPDCSIIPGHQTVVSAQNSKHPVRGVFSVCDSDSSR